LATTSPNRPPTPVGPDAADAGGRFEAIKKSQTFEKRALASWASLEGANKIVTLEMLDVASTRFRKPQFNASICSVLLNWKSDFVALVEYQKS
jgi:hypothetical protein